MFSAVLWPRRSLCAQTRFELIRVPLRYFLLVDRLLGGLVLLCWWVGFPVAGVAGSLGGLCLGVWVGWSIGRFVGW